MHISMVLTLEQCAVGTDFPAQAARSRAISQHPPGPLGDDQVLFLIGHLDHAVGGGAAKSKALGEIARVGVRAAVTHHAPSSDNELEREMIVVIVAARAGE